MAAIVLGSWLAVRDTDTLSDLVLRAPILSERPRQRFALGLYFRRGSVSAHFSAEFFLVDVS
jgi:hypothetical protein